MCVCNSKNEVQSIAEPLTIICIFYEHSTGVPGAVQLRKTANQGALCKGSEVVERGTFSEERLQPFLVKFLNLLQLCVACCAGYYWNGLARCTVMRMYPINVSSL